MIQIMLFFLSSVLFGNLDNQNESSNTVVNKTNVSDINLIVEIGLDYLEVEDVVVIVMDVLPNANTSMDGQIKGYVIKPNTPGRDDMYFLFIDVELNKRSLIETISHELVHIKQQSTGKLVPIDNRLSEFNGRTVLHNRVKYKDRPWEYEAFQKQRKIMKFILNGI